MTNSAIEKSQRLSNSRMQRLSSMVSKLCTKYRLPHIHGCVWDRHCRWCGAPRRVQLLWGRHDFMVDLPGYDEAKTWYRGPLGDRSNPEHVPGSWQLVPHFQYWRHDKAEADD